MRDNSSNAISDALTALQRGKHARAERLLRDVIASDPRHVPALMILGTLYGQRGRSDQAAAQFERVIALHPDNADAHYNLGAALADRGSKERALDCYRAALAAEPGHTNALNNLAAELLLLERWDEVLAVLEQPCRERPGDPLLLSKLGVALKERGRVDEAVAVLKQAIRAQPAEATARANLGLALRQAGRLDEAVESLRRAVLLDPSAANYHQQLGLTLYEHGKVEPAIESLRRAIALSPQSAELRSHLGMMLLAKGEFREGWAEREYRATAQRPADRPRIDAPVWKGEPLTGKSILVYSEQGAGDTLQFARYLPKLATMAAAVTFEVQPRLMPILGRLSHSVSMVAEADSGQRFDYQCALLSVPGACGTDLSNIPSEVPYLAADEALAARWGAKIAGNGFKVGICWQGNTGFLADRQRSIPLHQFAPLAEIPGARLFSLQAPPASAQIAGSAFSHRIETVGEAVDQEAGSFMDTAAVMMHLDLIIACDTSVAHLAGALGRPVFIALSHAPDWRWLRQREDSPWYPTARLFRQDKAGEWTPVFDRIAAAVRAAAGADRGLACEIR